MNSATPSSLWLIFLWPIVLASLIVVGLLSALLTDGIGDRVSWVLLSIPLVVSLVCVMRGRERK